MEIKENKSNNNDKFIKKLILIIVICSIIVVGLVCIYNKFNKEKEGEKIYRRDFSQECIDKPIIYLYPEKEQNIKVELLNKERITCSYPKYKEGWNVKAKPNGVLKDLDSGKDLYSLYYESKTNGKFEIENEGFVVKSEDISRFLEEKLDILGLNYKEKEEFIVYWLPKLEANKYNYIRFAEMDEINNNMGLQISPKPDTLIRILMTFKGLDAPIEVKEQELTKVERKGYSVIEWGGSEIK